MVPQLVPQLVLQLDPQLDRGRHLIPSCVAMEMCSVIGMWDGSVVHIPYELHHMIGIANIKSPHSHDMKLELSCSYVTLYTASLNAKIKLSVKYLIYTKFK